MSTDDESAEQQSNPFAGHAEFAANPQPMYAQLRESCPVLRMEGILPGAMLSRYDDVLWALREPALFSSETEDLMALGTVRPMIPQQIDPPLQTQYRRILDPRFSRRRMAALKPALAAHASRLIDAFVDRGECEFDREFAIPLPCTAFLILMGLPVEELDLFLELKNNVIRPPGVLDDLDQATRVRKETGQRIYDYFEKLIDERTAAPRDDMMTYLTTVEMEGRRLSRNEILDICFLLLLGGLDTVTATLGCSFAYLAQHPVQRREIARYPDLIPGAIEELLRWETPVPGVPRVLKRDVELHGQKLTAGELVTLSLGSANTDDIGFEDASRVDFQRLANRHLAFGGGPHRCLGSHLARLELVVAFEEWHRRIPEYTLKEGETPQYSPSIREVEYLPLVWDVQQPSTRSSPPRER